MSKSRKNNPKKKDMKDISIKKIIIFFLIGGITILGGIVAFSAFQSKSLLPPKIVLSEDEWDFGQVLPDAKPVHVFKITNGGEKDLIIERVNASCGCIKTSITATTIPPGKSVELEVIYDTTGYSGKDEKHVHIYSNDPLVPDKWIDLYVETE